MKIAGNYEFTKTGQVFSIESSYVSNSRNFKCTNFQCPFQIDFLAFEKCAAHFNVNWFSRRLLNNERHDRNSSFWSTEIGWLNNSKAGINRHSKNSMQNGCPDTLNWINIEWFKGLPNRNWVYPRYKSANLIKETAFFNHSNLTCSTNIYFSSRTYTKHKWIIDVIKQK